MAGAKDSAQAVLRRSQLADRNGAEVPQEILSSETRLSRLWRSQTIFVCAAVLLAAVLRTWALNQRGAVGFDETYYYMLGRSLVTEGSYMLNGLPHTAFPPLYPLLVGLASLLRNDIAFAASSVSAVFGALVVLPVYFLAVDIHGKRAGLLAAIIAAAWPGLWFFAARGVPYASRLYAGSTPLYTALLLSGACFLWLAARRGGWVRSAVAGTFFGAASLVRSEGPVVFAFLVAWFVVDRLIERRRLTRGMFVDAASMCLAALLVMLPFFIYLHHVTGQWSLGAKLSNKVHIRRAYWQWATEDDNRAFLEIHYRLNDDATWMNEPYWGVSQWHRDQLAAREGGSLAEGTSAVFTPQLRWVGMLAGYFYKGPGALVPGSLALLLLAGIFIGPWDRRRLRWWLLLTVSFLPFLLIAVSFGIMPRNVVPFLPLLAICAGKGLDGIWRAAERGAGGSVWGRRMAQAGGVATVVLLVSIFIRTGVRQNVLGGIGRAGIHTGLVNQRAEAEMGQYLKAKYGPGRTLMANKPWIAVWAGFEWRVLPIDSWPRMLQYATNREIDFLLLERWQVGSQIPADEIEPYLEEVLEFKRLYYLLNVNKPAERAELESP